MKTLDEIKNILSQHKEEIKQKYEVREIGIFGSYVRGEEREASDIDILVELGKAIGLLKFIEIEEYLSDLLGVKVDLVMKGALKPRIGERILKEVVYV
ncbi:MAG: nucleotidyltransferase family protein [Candidatus Methanoperedens sp.]|nr:nucleotidyltransferase family protein [Candidatus Methanoperedens sp.]